jgi:hypothetical protein
MYKEIYAQIQNFGLVVCYSLVLLFEWSSPFKSVISSYQVWVKKEFFQSRFK